MRDKFSKYFSDHKVELILLLIILVVSTFLRIYKISDYMTFLGDEGRDAIVAKDILQGDFTLLGPRASAGDFFLGPVYYYLMTPFLLLSGFDPVGPAIMVALFGIATVYLVYHVGNKFFGIVAGLTAASLYAVSPLVIAYSRSSWNPNLMPFVSLLLLYLLYKAVRLQSLKIFIIVGLLAGIAIQLHYLTVFLGVIAVVFVLIGQLLVSRKHILKKYLTFLIGIAGGFFISILPFLLFEIRHGFPNVSAITRFVFADNTSQAYSIGQSFTGNITDVSFRLFARLLTKFPSPEQMSEFGSLSLTVWVLGTVTIASLSIFALFKVKDKLAILLLSTWLILGVFLFAFYKKPIYDYYLGFMFPLPFLLFGNMFSRAVSFQKYRIPIIVLSAFVFAGLITLNLSGNPFRYPPNKQKDQAKNIAEFVLSKTEGKPFNFALLTDGNSDHVYRYFFEVEGRAPVTILNVQDDPGRKSVTEQLLIVCEKPECSVLGNSLWEVAGFGRAEIAGEWSVPHVKVFRLIHYEE